MGSRIFITGISGLLGNNLALALRDEHEVHGSFLSHPVAIPGVRALPLDLTDYAATREQMLAAWPDVVLHCASRTDVDRMELDREGAWQAGVLATRTLVDALRDSPARLVFISTDSVFPGTQGPYAENMPTGPRNYYGQTKLEAEGIVHQREGSLILRTNLFGWNIQDKLSLGEWFLQRLALGLPTPGFTDAWFNPTYTFDLAAILRQCLERNLSGLFNCAARDSMTKFEFGVALARVFGFDPRLVRPARLKDASLAAPRGGDLRLDVSRLENALGTTLPTVLNGLNAFRQHHAEGLSARIKAVPADLPGRWHPVCSTLPYGRQAIDEADISAVVRVLRSPFITQGPEVEAFEKELAGFVGARHGVAVNSATSALHLACLCCGLGPGDEAVTSPITFLASANCAAYCGATPVFADIDPATGNLSPQELERRITQRTRVVIPVHFAGQSCDTAGIRAVVAKKEQEFGRKIFIVEDASHALGSVYRNERVGSCRHSDMVVFSFHPVKHITTGEGGMLVTQNADLADKARMLRNHGIVRPDDAAAQELAPWHYEQHALGYNYRLTDMQAALGCSQLAKLPLFVTRRRAIVDLYNALLGDLSWVQTPFEATDCHSNFHLYVLRLDFEALGMSRAQVMLRLRQQCIFTQVHYIPVHLQPYYQQNFGTRPGDFPVAEAFYERCLSLPLYPAMSFADVDRVVQALGRVIGPDSISGARP